MRLVISKKKTIGMSWAVLLTTILVYSISIFFFTLISNYTGSDYAQNLQNTEAAITKGYLGGNTPNNILEYLLFDAHFYLWLVILNNLYDSPSGVLQGLTVAATFALIFPTALVAGQQKNRFLLFLLLLAIFLHPRFIDLVAGNIRSACALSLLFWAITLKDSKLKYLLIFIAPTFHLGTIPVLALYFTHRFWKKMPKFFSQVHIKTASIFLIAGVLCLSAKTVFPDRGDGSWEGGMFYTIAIVVLFSYVFFLGRYFVNNQFGFMALGLISMVIWGAIIDYATMRYLSFFLPFFGAALIYFHRQPEVLTLSLSVMAVFTSISHMTYLIAS